MRLAPLAESPSEGGAVVGSYDGVVVGAAPISPRSRVLREVPEGCVETPLSIRLALYGLLASSCALEPADPKSIAEDVRGSLSFFSVTAPVSLWSCICIGR